MTSNGISLMWFRDDLRVSDQPALTAAVARGKPVAALYILDATGDGRPLGAAARWKRHGALLSLEASLAALNVPLILKRGDPAAILDGLVSALGVDAVYWSRRYGPDVVAQDKALMAGLRTRGVAVASFNGRLLAEPWTVKTRAGGWFKVFTPFCRAARAAGDDLRPLPAPAAAPAHDWPKNLGDDIDGWGLAPPSPAWTEPDWTEGLAERWAGGEAAAAARLRGFLDDGFKGYRDGRNLPAAPHVSGLSPYLATGEISPRQARQAALVATEAAGGTLDADFEAFERELYWRDFSHNLLFFSDGLATQNFQEKFDGFQWASDEAAFQAWAAGRTGYPIVDAGMRELWRTGYMHNRVRMIAASFLAKHLLIDWRRGEEWFWNTLVDADPASNPANWQWVAGSGADAAPYFRIFNPMTQGPKFDPAGDYVRKWVPELAALPSNRLGAPWTAPEHMLSAAGFRLGETYPHPIVDHGVARERALAAFGEIKPG